MNNKIIESNSLASANKATVHIFYRHIHVFRALTIILIVAAHAWIMPLLSYSGDYSVDLKLKLLNSIFQTLFHDSTVLFAFISGLLFSLILYSRGWTAFFSSKVKNVLAPYIVMTFLYTFVQWKVVWVGFYKIKPDNMLGYLNVAIDNIAKGLAGFHLWYIPVLLVLFICTPLLQKVVNYKSKIGVAIIVLAPLLVSRVSPHFSWKTVVYFAGAYVLGMFIGAHYRDSLALISRYKKLISIAFLMFSVASIYVYYVDINKLGFVALKESILYAQKIAMTLLLLHVVYTFEIKFPKWLDVIGHYSFSIYFLHLMILLGLMPLVTKYQLLSNNPWQVLVIGFVLFIATLGFSVLITKVIKIVTGKYSRMILGA